MLHYAQRAHADGRQFKKTAERYMLPVFRRKKLQIASIGCADAFEVPALLEIGNLHMTEVTYYGYEANARALPPLPSPQEVQFIIGDVRRTLRDTQFDLVLVRHPDTTTPGNSWGEVFGALRKAIPPHALLFVSTLCELEHLPAEQYVRRAGFQIQYSGKNETRTRTDPFPFRDRYVIIAQGTD